MSWGVVCSVSDLRYIDNAMGKNILFTLLTIGFCLAVVEGAVNAIRLGDDTPFVLDETLIYHPNPSARFTFVQMPENGGEVIWTEFDERGHRVMDGGNLATADLAIGVYGDSFIQGSFVQSEETFAYYLHKELEQRAQPSIATFNAGLDGYGPDQTYLRLRQAVSAFRHDMVIFSIFADNDLGDLVRNKILFRQENGGLGFRTIELAPEVIESYRRKRQLSNMFAIERAIRAPDLIRKELRVLLERRLNLTIPFVSSVEINSAYKTDSATNWIETWLARSQAEFQEYSVGKKAIIHLDNIRSDHYDVDVSTAPTSHSARTKIALFDSLVRELRTLFDTSHIFGLLLIIPSPIDVCAGYDWQIDKRTFPDYDPRLLTTIIAKSAAKHGLPFINLFDVFHVKACNELYYHHGNNHWTPRGQKLAATIVADRLIQDATLQLSHTHQ